MKSIKEKSVEHLNSVYAGYDNVLKELVKEGYVSGANYVLNQVSEILHVSAHACLKNNLFEMIKQLKK